MITSQIYILISIAVLLVVAVLLLFVKKKGKNKKERRPKLTPLAGFAFAFIITGILFGDNRLIGYSLIGIGVLLAVIDIVKRLKKK
jgi:amino acid transporter